MAFIQVISVEQAQGRLADLYRRVRGPDGQVDNVLKVHSLRPHSLYGHMTLYKSVLHHSANTLPKWFLEAIGVLVSRINGCNYCERHHAAGMQRLLAGRAAQFDDYLAALDMIRAGEPFDRAQQAALVYVRKLTQTPDDIEADDIEAMREAGLDDGQILEVNQVAAYFAYANRTVSGLGVNVDGEVIGLAPGDSDDPENWGHH